MVKCDVRIRAAKFGIGLLWMGKTSIILPFPTEAADSQSPWDVDNTAETTTSSFISEPLPIILNEPSFIIKTALPEQVKGAIQLSDNTSLTVSSGTEDTEGKDLLEPKGFEDKSAEYSETAGNSEISYIHDHFQVQDSSETPDKRSKDVRGSVSRTVFAADISIPPDNVVDCGVIHPKAKASEHLDNHQNDLNFDVSQVSSIDVDFDDRSLLDVFGEVAKEYLTQRVVCVACIVIFISILQQVSYLTLLFLIIAECLQIPPTDVDCRWDWRSCRCESSCRCHFQWKRGDFHLGRACRRRFQDLVLCPPTVFVVDRPIPKRLVSLLQQTSDIFNAKLHRLLDNVYSSIKYRFVMLQNRLCADLWSYLYEAVDGSQCWLWIPTSTTILERMFCGRNIRLILPCRDEILSSSQQNRLPGSTSKNLDRRFQSRQFHPNSNFLTGFSEKEML